MSWDPPVSVWVVDRRWHLHVRRLHDNYSAFLITGGGGGSLRILKIKQPDFCWILAQNLWSTGRLSMAKETNIWHSNLQSFSLTRFNYSLPPTSASALIDLMCHLCYSCLPQVFCKTWGIFILLFSDSRRMPQPQCLACVSLVMEITTPRKAACRFRVCNSSI